MSPTITVTSDGLELPEEFTTAEKLVIRTPTKTIDMSTGFQSLLVDGVFPLITQTEYESVQEQSKSDMKNPELFPDKISLKRYGGNEHEFIVTIE